MYVLISNEISVDACVSFKTREAATEWAQANRLEHYQIRNVMDNLIGW